MTGIDDVRRAAGFARRHPALAVKCPHCRARPGEPCVSPSGRRRMQEPHPSRLDQGPDAQVIPINPPPKAS